jgi:long-chain acyl-CoA synthetase
MSAKNPQTLPQWLMHNAATRPHEVAQRHKRDGVWKEFNWTAVRDEVRAIAWVFGRAACSAARPCC